MKPTFDIKPVRLPARAIRRIEDGAGLEVTVLDGTVWITQAEDLRDIILGEGQSFVLDRNGRAVIYAIKDAAFVVAPAGHVAVADPAAPAAWDAAA